MNTPIVLARGPLLFLLAIEPLACMIRQNAVIKGIPLSHEQALRLAMYAEDTTLGLGSVAELQEAEQILIIFEAGSGAKINNDKSELLPVSSHSFARMSSRFALRPYSYEARLLGAPIGMEQTDSISWGKATTKIKKIITKWNPCAARRSSSRPS